MPVSCTHSLQECSLNQAVIYTNPPTLQSLIQSENCGNNEAFLTLWSQSHISWINPKAIDHYQSGYFVLLFKYCTRWF